MQKKIKKNKKIGKLPAVGVMVGQQGVEDGSDFLLFATFFHLQLHPANAGVEEEEEKGGCNERRHFEVGDEAVGC